MTKCIVCGTVMKNDEYGICENCVKRNLTIDTALAFGRTWTEEVEINGFLASYFRDHIVELEQILIEEIRGKQECNPDVVKKSLQEYFDYDRDSFIRWMEEKWDRQR